MALSNMQVFNEYIMPLTIETFAQDIEKFNAASNGAIRLTAAGFTGDFTQESFFTSLAAAKRRVDRYTVNAAVASTPLAQAKQVGVKVAGGFGPIVLEKSQFAWLQNPTTAGVEAASRAFSEILVADQVNTAIAALVAAIEAQAADTVNDVSATSGMNYTAMNNAHALFGDASNSLVATVMNGLAYHKVINTNLTAGMTPLFTSRDVNIVEGILGKPIIVTDAPALYVPGAPSAAKVKALSLAEGAVVVYDGGNVDTHTDVANGKERIETTFQADYDFGLMIKGYSWNDATGGKSPTDAELATGANWTKVVSSIKHTAGVMTIGNGT